jgi:RND family efflux transporter MFP subunit
MFKLCRQFLLVATVLAGVLNLSTVSFAQNGEATVEASPLERVVSFPTRESFAEVVSLNESRLAAEAAGVVRQWHADVGSSVKSGALLLSLDDRDARLALAQAKAATGAMKARLELAQSHAKRAKDLSATGFVSKEVVSLRQTELALAQADLESAQAQQDLAARQLEKMQLLAPFDGVILERHAQVGEKLPAGTLAFVLTDPSAVEVQSQLSFDQIGSLQKAQSIQATIGGETYQLRLLRVSPVAVLPSRTQSVRLGFESHQRPVAGATGQIRWQVGDPLLQPDLLVRRNNQIGIFVLEPKNKHWQVRFVAIANAQEGRRTPAPSLATDSLVVNKGQQRLQDGQVLDQADVRLRSP